MSESSRHDKSPRQWRKKPVIIEAVRWTGANIEEVLPFFGDFSKLPRSPDDHHVHVGIGHCPPEGTLDIPTLEGTMTARAGDWIIKGVKGEFYPCKPDIFEQTYEAVSAPSSIGTTGETLQRIEPQYLNKSVSGAWVKQWQDRADQLERELAEERAGHEALRLLAQGWKEDSERSERELAAERTAREAAVLCAQEWKAKFDEMKASRDHWMARSKAQLRESRAKHMSLCPHGYTAFWDCPECEYPMGTRNAPEPVTVQERHHVAAAALPEIERPCATCNGDPEVCAWVPGLRHCEKAQRAERVAPENDGTAHIDHPLRHFDQTCRACWRDDALEEAAKVCSQVRARYADFAGGIADDCAATIRALKNAAPQEHRDRPVTGLSSPTESASPCVVVPLEPTEEMIAAAGETPKMKFINGILSTAQLRQGVTFDKELGGPLSECAIAQAYKAMLAAAAPLLALPPSVTTPKGD